MTLTAERVQEPAWARRGSWVLCPVLGFGLLLLLKLLLQWLATLSWVPFDGKMRFLAAIPLHWALLVAVVVGGGAGLAFAHLWDRDRLVVQVTPERAELSRGKKTSTVGRDDVRGVFLDDGQLVVLENSASEAAREDLEMVSKQQLLAAFRAHGWPVLDKDPHAAEYRLWVPEDPNLPTGANTLLKEREKALKKSVLGVEDARKLRDELARDGVVVRQEDKRQYWRPAPARR